MTEDIEKITESIISEKWGKLSSELKNMMEWKNELSKQLDSYKKKVEDLDNKLAQTQTAMIGKVDEYNKSIGDVNVEIQAMGKVFEKLIPEFTNNVKELSEIVKKHK
jgi:predicted  nucleic acid-binding Zn-ribbon protein